MRVDVTSVHLVSKIVPAEARRKGAVCILIHAVLKLWLRILIALKYVTRVASVTCSGICSTGYGIVEGFRLERHRV